jgi:hypothetical protein
MYMRICIISGNTLFVYLPKKTKYQLINLHVNMGKTNIVMKLTYYNNSLNFPVNTFFQ